MQPDAHVGIVSLGSCHAAVLEAIDRLREQGIVADYMRIKAFPFNSSVREFIWRQLLNQGQRLVGAVVGELRRREIHENARKFAPQLRRRLHRQGHGGNVSVAAGTDVL